MIWIVLLQFTDQLTWIIENNLDINSLYNYSILTHDDIKQKLWFQLTSKKCLKFENNYSVCENAILERTEKKYIPTLWRELRVHSSVDE